MKVRSVLLLALGALATSASAQSILFGDFENSLGIWEAEGGQTESPLTFSSTTGVTNGSFALEARLAAGYKQPIKTFSGDISPQLRLGGTLTYDLTIPAGEFSGSGAWFQTFAAWVGETTDFANPMQDIANDGTTKTISVTLPTVSSTQAFYGIFIGVNNDPTWTTPAGGARVYIDNVRFTPVPEPASMAVLGLGLAAFRKRRRA